MKLEPPFRIDGRGVIYGKNGERLAVDGVTITAVDPDGYVRLDIRPVPGNRNSDVALGKRLGVVVAKSRSYEVISTPKAFRVVSCGPEGSRVVNKQITHQLLAQVFTEISKHPALRFNEIRRGLRESVKDAIELKAALAVLETAGCVKCDSEGKFVYYRKVKEWSLTIFQ
jgi:hypothetical protein